MAEIAKILLKNSNEKCKFSKEQAKNKYKNLLLITFGLLFIGLATMFIIFGFGVAIYFAIGLGVEITSGTVGFVMIFIFVKQV